MRRIFINLERRTPPGRFRIFGARLVPTFNYFQTALVLHEEGMVPLAAVVAVGHSLIERADLHARRSSATRSTIWCGAGTCATTIRRCAATSKRPACCRRRPRRGAGRSGSGAGLRRRRPTPERGAGKSARGRHRLSPARRRLARERRPTRRRERRDARRVVVLSTAGSQDEAERIATALVDERLAACVNLVAPLTSIYRWQGAVERAEEVLLVIKTRRAWRRA